MGAFGRIAMAAALAGAVLWARPCPAGQEVPFTLEDRDRLVRVETSLREFKESVEKRFEQIDKRFEQIDKRFEQIDKRFEQIDKRFEQIERRFDDMAAWFDKMMQFIWILAAVLGGLVAATIGFAVWDRRTALEPALRRSRALEEREERIERALRLLAEKDPNVQDALRQTGLL